MAPRAPRAPRARITPELEAFLESAAGIWAATSDGQGNPEATRVVGYHARDKGRVLTLYVLTESSGRALQNLEANREITVFYASMTEYRAVQIKGEVVSVRESRAADRKHQEAYKRRYIEQATKVGVAHAIVSRLNCWPSTAIDLAVRELTVQTPGPQAGTQWR